MSSEMINITEESNVYQTSVSNLRKFTCYLGSMLIYLLNNPTKNTMVLFEEKSNFFEDDNLKSMIMDHLYVYTLMQKSIVEKSVFVATDNGGKYENRSGTFFTYPGKYKRVNPLVYYLLENICGIPNATKIFFITTDIVNIPNIRGENINLGSALILASTYDDLEFLEEVTRNSIDPEMDNLYKQIDAKISNFNFREVCNFGNQVNVNAVFVSESTKLMNWNFYRSVRGTLEGIMVHNNSEMITFFNQVIASIGEEIEVRQLKNEGIVLDDLEQKFNELKKINIDKLNSRQNRKEFEEIFLSNKTDPITKANVVMRVLPEIFNETHLNRYAPYSNNLKIFLNAGEVPDTNKKENTERRH